MLSKPNGSYYGSNWDAFRAVEAIAARAHGVGDAGGAGLLAESQGHDPGGITPSSRR